MPPIIEVNHLSKKFSEIHAVDDLSFTVQQGDVYGFLGQNGAGKSTTIRMMLGLIKPTAGSISIFGHDLNSHRKEILKQTGAIIERPDLYQYLSALDNLTIFARMSGVPASRKKILEQLDKVGLADRHAGKVKTFSQGMKQRLGLAVALVHDPKLIILDEPVNGLDPQGIADIRMLIKSLSRDQGKTVIISSHLLFEIEQVASRMLIIHKGKKVAEGVVAEMLDPAHTIVLTETADNERALVAMKQIQWMDKVALSGQYIRCEMNRMRVPDLVSFLTGIQVDILSIQPRHSLEDYFLNLTNPVADVDVASN